MNLACRVAHRVEFRGSHRWFVGEIEAVQIEEGYARDQALMYWLSEYRSVGQIVYKVERRWLLTMLCGSPIVKLPDSGRNRARGCLPL